MERCVAPLGQSESAVEFKAVCGVIIHGISTVVPFYALLLVIEANSRSGGVAVISDGMRIETGIKSLSGFTVYAVFNGYIDINEI